MVDKHINNLDKSRYEYSDLTDEEILAREERFRAQAAKESEKERKRWEKARNFRFTGGLL